MDDGDTSANQPNYTVQQSLRFLRGLLRRQTLLAAVFAVWTSLTVFTVVVVQWAVLMLQPWFPADIYPTVMKFAPVFMGLVYIAALSLLANQIPLRSSHLLAAHYLNLVQELAKVQDYLEFILEAMRDVKRPSKHHKYKIKRVETILVDINRILNSVFVDEDIQNRYLSHDWKRKEIQVFVRAMTHYLVTFDPNTIVLRDVPQSENPTALETVVAMQALNGII